MRPDVAAAFDRMARGRARDGHHPGGQLGLPLRRRTGGAVRRPPRPALGGAAGPLAAPLRDRARPRPASGLRLARRQRRPLRLPPALLVGALALRLRGGPAPCSAAGDAVGERRERRRRRRRGRAGLPAFVPARFRDAARCAPPRAGTSPPALLAAQLMAESNFNPFAVSPAGAAGDRPVHARDGGRLRARRPVRRRAAIDAQAHLMSDLLRQFGSRRTRPRRLQRGPGAGRSLRLRPRDPGDAGLRGANRRPDGRGRGDCRGADARGAAGGLRPPEMSASRGHLVGAPAYPG